MKKRQIIVCITLMIIFINIFGASIKVNATDENNYIYKMYGLGTEAHDWDADNEMQLDAAAEVIRDKITERDDDFAIIIYFVCEEGKPYQISQVGQWIIDRACSDEYYQNSSHGDYLEASIAENSRISYTSLGQDVVDNSRERFLLKITYNLKYCSTKEQEDILNANINTWINNNIDIENDTDVEKIKKIYKYVTSNVDYDYTYQKRSAYNAFVEGESVCSGYAMLIYKMFKMSGIEDVYIITGTAYNGEKTESHAWNLVKLDDKYYYLDATWDATLHGDFDDKVENMTYFLSGSDVFDKDHFPENEINPDFDISKERYFKEEIKDDENIEDDEEVKDEEENNKQYINTISKLKEKNIDNVSIISGIDSNTNIDDFQNQNNFNLEYIVKIFNYEDEEITNEEIITTGSKVRLYKEDKLEKEYTIVIYGDVSGDGDINPYDALYLIKAINSKVQFKGEAHKEAGRIFTEGSEDPTAIDALAIVKAVNNKYTINQSK